MKVCLLIGHFSISTNRKMRREIQNPQMLKTDHQTNLPAKSYIFCAAPGLAAKIHSAAVTI
jgi:hypothetical protein